MELFVTRESPEWIVMNKISQRGETPLGDVLKPRAHDFVGEKGARRLKNKVPGAPLTLTCGTTLSRQAIIC